MGKVVHFEIPADDIARAKEFYGSIFGWQLQDMEGEAMGGYTLAMTTSVDQATQVPTEPGAINGGLMKRSGDTPSPVITIEVDGIDDALKKVEAEGGSTVQTRTEIPGMGAFAYFKDPEGNVMGLWETRS
jgi:predicted enzyme related to lactoylglutathione lyase